MITRINIYHQSDQWCYTAIDHGERDHSDRVGISGDATAEEVRAELAKHFPDARIVTLPLEPRTRPAITD